jgi:hypothetical protein
MDVLGLQVIPQFRNRLLGTFHAIANVGGETKIPLDSDIRAFYERFQKLHAPTLACGSHRGVEKIENEMD